MATGSHVELFAPLYLSSIVDNCMPRHIKSDYNISSGSTVIATSLTVICLNVTGPDMGPE